MSQRPVLEIKGSDESAEESPLDPVSAFRLSDGRYAVADGDQNGWDALLVYSAKGKFIKHVGREGRGPGEFAQLLSWGGSYRGDSIAAYDFVDRAVEIFTPAGGFARAIKLPRNKREVKPPRGTYGAGEFFIGAMADGTLLTFDRSALSVPDNNGPVYYKPELNLHDANGQNVKTLATLPTWGFWWNGKEAAEYMFQPPALTVAGQDVWYHANGDDFTIQVFDANARLLRTLHRPYTPESVTPEDREALIRYRVEQVRSSPREGGSMVAERIENDLRTKAHFAESKPPFTSMLEDSERNLWVEHYRWIYSRETGPNPRPTRWSVFDRRGRFLGEVEVPASFRVSSITRDQVLGFWNDEFDVEHVRVYSLIRPES